VPLEEDGLVVHLLDHVAHKGHRSGGELRLVGILVISRIVSLLEDLVHLLEIVLARQLLDEAEPFVQGE